MLEEDSNKLANIDEISNHLDYIFSSPFGNNAFLISRIENNELISMVNFFEYNNRLNEWCLFSLFTNQKYRRKDYAINTLKYGLNKLKKINVVN